MIASCSKYMKKYPVGQWNGEGTSDWLRKSMREAGTQRMSVKIINKLAHTFDPNTGWRLADLCEFRDNLVCI